MKTLLAGLLLFSAAIAHAECNQLEAQVIAATGAVIAEDATTCTVKLDFSIPHAQLNSSFTCPLDVDDVSNGVTFPKVLGVCTKAPGTVISGILYRATSGNDTRIYLY
ncbi:hypothetical protein [Bdellovibrio sp. NC01]|uniref:hypothetical protein n=1 Tax=Bdellovibrio sp. NC01 TaxID=2220073 RepID=UPI00115C1F94|nr:hypothetical protein [Bdellovibrio sp. NC01]QDK37061.1 hypothetical protein DOE51_05365 [Bdellovibrio sp. NC01]